MKARELRIMPQGIVEIVRRFACELVPHDLKTPDIVPLRVTVISEEFPDRGPLASVSPWSPTLDITRTDVDDAIDELKSGLDLLIDAVPVDVQGAEIHLQAKEHFARALALLTDQIETGEGDEKAKV
jgi:hypothetical protein